MHFVVFLVKLLTTPPPGGVCAGERCLRSFLNKNRLEMHFVVFLVTTAFFSYSRMGQISSTLLMDIHLGTLTSQTWW